MEDIVINRVNNIENFEKDLYCAFAARTGDSGSIIELHLAILWILRKNPDYLYLFYAGTSKDKFNELMNYLKSFFKIEDETVKLVKIGMSKKILSNNGFDFDFSNFRYAPEYKTVKHLFDDIPSNACLFSYFDRLTKYSNYPDQNGIQEVYPTDCCPICSFKRHKYVSLRCGHQVCRDCYNTLKEEGPHNCPYCRKPI